MVLYQIGPGLLRAGVQAVLAREQHDVLHEHAEVGPLIRAHAPIDREEQHDRRAEELVVAREVPQARGLVLARDAERRVQILAALEAPRAIGLVQVRRIHVVFGAFARRAASRCFARMVPRNSASGAPVSTSTRHGCRLPPEGARFAASRISTTMCFGTGVSRNARQLMRLSMASETMHGAGRVVDR